MMLFQRILVLFLTLVAADAVDAQLLRRSRRDVDDNLVERSMTHDGLTRWFVEHRPSSYQSFGNSTRSALVILLHGGTESMRQTFKKNRKGARRWLTLSDTHGFLLLAPNGVNDETGGTKGDDQNWNDYRPEFGGTRDDVGFLSTLVSWAIAERGVNAQRIYITGASNGGMMTYRALIDTYPPIYAAGAAFIANLPAIDVPVSNRSKPIFIMNGTRDKLQKWEGGQGGFDRGDVRSALATRDYWVEANGADKSKVQRTKLPNRNLLDGCRVVSDFYPASSLANNSAPVQFYTMEGGGHAIPYTSRGRYSWLYRLVAGPQCREVNGADLAWEYMSKFTLTN
jgi:polyhydroxybutyrate depolymerase